MSVTSSEFTHCPVCRYDLTGLPKEHRCPECSFEYDETMTVWWMPAVPRWMLLVLWIVSSVVLYEWLGRAFAKGLGLRSEEALLVVLFLAGVAPFIGLFYPRGFVAAGRNGLSYRFPLRPVRTIPWDQIRVSPTSQRLSRVRGDAEVSLLLPSIGLRWRRRKALNAAIARRWRQATSA